MGFGSGMTTEGQPEDVAEPEEFQPPIQTHYVLVLIGV
jgi:hypothetical protein